MSVLDLLGETPEFGGTRVVVPESYYPMTLSVGEIGVTETREGTGGEGGLVGGTPYVELGGEITNGPYKGVAVSERLWLTPGKIGSKGGMIGLLNAACKTITGQPAVVAALGEFGIELPEEFPEGTSDEEARAEVRRAFIEGFAGLTPDQRLALMTKYLRLGNWDGKQVIGKVGLEEQSVLDDMGRPMVQNGVPVVRRRNRWMGFHGVQEKHKTHGTWGGYFTKVCLEQQKLAKAKEEGE
jgi:hypothetical protein